MKLLRYLQSKPREVKAQYAALIAGIATGAITVVWASTLPSRFAEVPPLPKEDGNSITELISDTKSQLGNIIGAGDASKANIGRNLNLLTTEGVASSTESIGGRLIGEESTPAESELVSTTTGEKRVLIETTKIIPRTILIGTTTSGE